MRRRTFDSLMSIAGLLLAAVLIVAGGLLTWGHNYITGEVHDQLAAQKIFFPEADSPAVAGPEFKEMRRYSGQQLLTGAQARTYADDFIAAHLKESGGGLTYAELSSKSNANPDDEALAAQVQTQFRGETLRGLLLNAYAFGTMGHIAGIAAIAAFIGGGLMLILSALGLYHSRKTPPEEEILID
ncbi:MAG: hypothetical protein WBF71_07600 [Microthrixaceae bacterium]